jgi:prevent-host-death family protein
VLEFWQYSDNQLLGSKDMELLPETDTISSLKNKQAAVLSKVKKRPVLLLQNSKPLVVLVSPEEWNRTAMRLKELERNEVIRRRLQGAHAQSDPGISADEFFADLEQP